METSGLRAGTSYGEISGQANSPRQIQFALKVLF